ncbi:MAG: toprim domain-containing protein [Burkholderiaceae bacterium]|nr:toprim domain-containing protein [Burkholderiaceae bacterium]
MAHDQPLRAFDRSLLPPIMTYLQEHGIRTAGRGRQIRADCDLAEHSHRLSMTVDTEQGLWHCHGCAVGGDVLELHRRRMGLSFVEAAHDLGALVDGDAPPAPRQRPAQPAIADRMAEDADAARKRARAADLWGQARPIEPDTPAGQYLAGRCCVLPPRDADLRWLPDLQLFGFAGPAMVGRISGVLDAHRGLGLHLTWLECDGSRWRRTERRYLGSKAGGCVRLWPDEAVTHGLALAEGVESALAAAHLFAPAWSTLDAGNLAAFAVLPGVEALTVFADHDASGAGEKAALICAERWRDAGAEVRVILPEGLGRDVADEVAA